LHTAAGKAAITVIRPPFLYYLNSAIVEDAGDTRHQV